MTSFRAHCLQLQFSEMLAFACSEMPQAIVVWSQFLIGKQPLRNAFLTTMVDFVNRNPGLLNPV